MPHPLQTKVRQVARLAQSVRWAYGAAWVAAALLATGLVLGLADYLLRSDELGVRLIFSALAVAVVAAAGWKFLWPALAQRTSEVNVAQYIETRWPQLEDRLSSSLEFLAQTEDDPLAGSPELRRTVVAQATAQVDGLRLREVVDLRRPLPVAATAGVLVLVVALLCLAAPGVAWQAARRLALPWRADPWPRYNHLELVNARSRVPLGEPYRVEVKDAGGHLPERAKVYYWFEGQAQAEVEPQAMKAAGESLVHGLSRVTRPFRYKVIGGDDDSMAWQSVEIVEPPRVESLTITLHPPAYSGWPAEESSRHLHALADTTVTLAGRATKPLKSAAIHVTGEAAATIPLAIGKDGHSFSLTASAKTPWRLEKSGAYALVLTGEDGVEGGGSESFQIEIQPDAPPRIAIEQPEANTHFTPEAVVQLVGSVKDDLAIRRVWLRYSRSDQSDAGETKVLLFEGPAEPPPATTAAARAAGQTYVLNHQWNLAELQDLPAGATLTYGIGADDYRPQEDQSPARRITIITRDQLEDRIAQRQTFILGQLAEALDAQREARGQTQALAIDLQQTARVEQEDVVELQSAELNQRRVERLLAGEQDGVLAQIDGLVDLVRRNRLDNPDIERRIGELRTAVASIVKEQLPNIQRDLLTGLKAAQDSVRDADDAAGEVSTSIASAGQTQDTVLARLEGLLGNLSQWDNYRRFSRQVSQLRGEQQALADATKQQQLRTLSKTLEQLSPQERADLQKLGQRQTELARRLEKTLSQMLQTAGELSPSDPLAAQTLTDAASQARDEALSGKMHQAAQQLSENQLAQAAADQQELGQKLDELLDTLTGRREHELGRKLDKLREAADELKGLEEKLKDLREKTEQAAANPDEAARRRELERLQKEREQTQTEMERLARKLERLQAEKASQSLTQAAEHAQQAGESAEQGDAGGHQEQSELAEEQLENAQQEVGQQIAKAEQDLLDEQLARLEQSLQGMIDQETNIVDETARLEKLRQEHGSLTRGQAASVRTLAGQQRGVADEANDFAEKIKAAEVFYLGLTGAVGEMNRTAQRLAQAETGEAVQQSALQARGRLAQLLDALKSTSDEAAPNEEAGGSGSGGNQGDGQDGIQQLAQLKLLKMMQESLQSRTAQLDETRRRGQAWTGDEEAEVERLADEQGKLADLLFKLSQPADASPEDNLDTLPSDDGAGALEQELRNTLENGSIESPNSGEEESP